MFASWGLGEGAPLTRRPCPAPATAGAGHGQERYEPAPARVHGDVQHEAGLGRADGDLPPAHHPVWRPVRASPSVGCCPPSSTPPSKGCLQRGRGGPEPLGRQARKTLCSDSVTSGCRLSLAVTWDVWPSPTAFSPSAVGCPSVGGQLKPPNATYPGGSPG